MHVCVCQGGVRLQQFVSSRLPDAWVYFLYKVPVTLDHVVHKNAQPPCLWLFDNGVPNKNTQPHFCLTVLWSALTDNAVPHKNTQLPHLWLFDSALINSDCLTVVCPTRTLSHYISESVWQCFDQLWLFDIGMPHDNTQPTHLWICLTVLWSTLTVWQLCAPQEHSATMSLTVGQCFDHLWLTMLCPTRTLSHYISESVWQCFDQLWLFDSGVPHKNTQLPHLWLFDSALISSDCLTVVCPTRTLSYHISDCLSVLWSTLTVWQWCAPQEQPATTSLTVRQCFDQLWLWQWCAPQEHSATTSLTVWQCFDQLWLFDNGMPSKNTQPTHLWQTL